MRNHMLLDDDGLVRVRDDFCKQVRILLCCRLLDKVPLQWCDLFSLQMVAGLGAEPSSLLMIPSMVDIIPSGCACRVALKHVAFFELPAMH